MTIDAGPNQYWPPHSPEYDGGERRVPSQSEILALMGSLREELRATRDDRAVADQRRAAVLLRLDGLEKAMGELKAEVKPLSDAMLVARYIRWMVIGLLAFAGAVWGLIESGAVALGPR